MKEKILNTIVPDGRLAFFYTGQEGFIVKTPHLYFLIDGFLSVTDETSRMKTNYFAPIHAEELDFLDYVFCSHDHIDHTDPKTLRGIVSVNEKAKFIVPAPVVDRVVGYGVPEERIIAARDGEVIDLGPLFVMPVAAAHEELHRDENGDYCELGYVFDTEGRRFYHSGDCCIYEGMAEKIGPVDAAFLPVNGRSFYRLSHNVLGNMNIEEAVELSKELEAGLLVPLHFDLFPFNSLPEEVVRLSIEHFNPEQPYHIFKPGEGQFL